MRVEEVRLFVEGGNKDQDRSLQLQLGMSRFFRELSRCVETKGLRFSLKLCGDINSTFKIFCKEYEKHGHRALCVLLVDADGPIPAAKAPLVHLREQHRTWQPPCQDAKVYHCMVQNMEAWVLADRQRAAAHFGCDEALLPEGAVEELSKRRLEEVLLAVCAARGRKYHKIDDAAALLKLIDPTVVRSRVPRCDRLFTDILQALP